MRTTVDFTVSSFGLTVMYDPPGPGYHEYTQGSLDLSYDLGWHDEVTGIYLNVLRRKETSEFQRIEMTLTDKLRRIDPDIQISSGYFPNPMM